MHIVLPTLSKRQQKFFGLSIGKTAIRAIELDEHHRVITYAQTVLPSDILMGGQVQKEVFTKAMQELLHQKKFSTPYIAVCFPESYAYSREASFPTLSPIELHEAVSWQVGDMFPFPPTDIYYDWKILKKDAKTTSVLVVCSPKNVIDDYITVLQSVGLRPVAFTSSASVLGSLMPLTADENALLVEINERGSMATLVEHNVSFLTTTIAFSAVSPSDRIQQSIQLVRELLNYYKGKKNIDLDKLKLFITGEQANEAVKTEFSKIVPQTSLLVINTIPPAYHKTYATALGPLLPPNDPTTINLLPALYQTFYDEEEFNKSATSLFKLSVSIVGASLCLSLLLLVGIVIQKQAYTTEVNRFNAQLSNAGFDRNEVKRIDTQARLITTLFALKKTPEVLFTDISGNIPAGVRVAKWTFDMVKETLQISGVAKLREDVLALRSYMETSGKFEAIQVPLSSLELPENVEFTISAKIKKAPK